MKIEKYEFSIINHWIKINKDTLKNIYSTFLDIFNDKYNLELIDSKQLFFDLSVYMYYNFKDKYGITLFNSNEDKKKYLNSLIERNKNNDYDNNYDNNYDNYHRKIVNNNTDNTDNTNNSIINDTSSYFSCSENDYDDDNFDDCYKDEYYDELYNKFFNNDDETLYNFVPSEQN
jgi:hypothetical protein